MFNFKMVGQEIWPTIFLLIKQIEHFHYDKKTSITHYKKQKKYHY